MMEAGDGYAFCILILVVTILYQLIKIRIIPSRKEVTFKPAIEIKKPLEEKRELWQSSSLGINILQFCIAFHSELIFKNLVFKDNLSLSVTSKAIFREFAPLVEQAYYFHLVPNVERFHYYTPRKAIVYCLNIDWANFSSVTHIKFIFNQNISIANLPPSLTHIHNFRFGYAIVVNSLPPNITHIDGNFIILTSLPPTLKHLKANDRIQLGPIPPNIEHYSCSFCGLPLPFQHSITTLHLPFHFNEPDLACLPPTLLRLEFGYEYTHSVDNLPISLTQLRLASIFNQPLNHLPPNLIKLTICSTTFKQQLANLPSQLQILKLQKIRNPELSLNRLPSSLLRLQIHTNDYYAFKPISRLPPFLEILEFLAPLRSFPALPHTLHTLQISSHSNDDSIALTSLPKGLRILHTPGKFTSQLDSFPPSLQEFVVYENICGPIHTLPATVKIEARALNIHQTNLQQQITKLESPSYSFSGPHSFQNFSSLTELTVDEPIKDLPNSLQFLSFGNQFNHPLPTLPPALTRLSLGAKFNKALVKLPSSLTHLTVGYAFNRRINNLPPNLLELCCGHSFNQPVDNLPQSLRELSLRSKVFNHPVDNLPATLRIFILFSCRFSFTFANLPLHLGSLQVSSKLRLDKLGVTPRIASILRVDNYD